MLRQLRSRRQCKANAASRARSRGPSGLNLATSHAVVNGCSVPSMR